MLAVHLGGDGLYVVKRVVYLAHGALNVYLRQVGCYSSCVVEGGVGLANGHLCFVHKPWHARAEVGYQLV